MRAARRQETLHRILAEGDFEDTFDAAGQTARDGRAMSASCWEGGREELEEML